MNKILVVEDDKICIVDGETVVDVTEDLNNFYSFLVFKLIENKLNNKI